MSILCLITTNKCWFDVLQFDFLSFLAVSDSADVSPSEVRASRTSTTDGLILLTVDCGLPNSE